MEPMITRIYGTMHDEIIQYIASTILLFMSMYNDGLTETELKECVEYEDLEYFQEVLSYLQENNLIAKEGEYTYYVPEKVENEVIRICTCALANNINKVIENES